MLENFTQKRDGRGKRLSGLLAFSAFFHGILIAAVLFADQMRVEPVTPPPSVITFVDFAALPPPPPPPPPLRRRTPPKRTPRADEMKPQPKIMEFVAPRMIPEVAPRVPEVPEEAPDLGTEDGVEDGSVDGVKGGVILGMVEPRPPAPPAPPAPPPPTYQAPEIIRKRRIEGRDPGYPRIALAAGLEATLLVKLFITPEGAVGDIEFMKTDKQFEQTVREAIADWRFAAHTINGRPVGTYTVYKFVFKLR